MSSRLTTLAAPVLLVLSGTACSSSPSGTSTPMSTPGSSTANFAPTSCGLHTQFGDADGDNRCIEPPPAGAGYQFHYGPSDYNNAAEVAKYTLMPGQEVTDCVFFMMPNKEKVYFNSYNARMRPGSHHMLLYLQDQVVTETKPGDGPSACNQGINTRVLYGAQTPEIDVNGLVGGGPEDLGMAADIPAGKQAVLQAHFVNATSKPILREVWANMILIDKSQVTQIADFQFFIGGFGMNVPMGQTQLIHGQATVPHGVAPDFHMVMATGHYHAHTLEFNAWANIDGQKIPIVKEYNTLGVAPDPKNWYFASEHPNPVPNDATHAPGAYTGVLHLKPGDSVEWTCLINNNNVPGGIQFNNEVYTAEMCNLFGFYAPEFGSSNWTSACLTSGADGSQSTCL
jgi:hypothetical protein